MVWFRDPLAEFFQANKTSLEIDIYMQHDGNHAEFYAPYSGNTGFYYVQNTPRTQVRMTFYSRSSATVRSFSRSTPSYNNLLQYFLNSLLVSGDLITATRTHQAPFLSILSEHASLHGLRVKILPDDDFPGGMHFQHKPIYMKNLLNSSDAVEQDERPYIFHMSWSENKNRKLEFFQQMGEFYVKDSCLIGSNTSSRGEAGQKELSTECCSAEPIIKCHYR